MGLIMNFTFFSEWREALLSFERQGFEICVGDC